jgi:UDP:flavonoid glycosyltransferase YjiC (YdhE family)
MNVLLAGLASPGLVFPLIAVAERLRARGHRAAFVTDLPYAEHLEARGFARIPRSARDGRSFELDGWGNPLRVAMQVRHLEYALERDHYDVVLASHLALGPLLIREMRGVPVAMLGSLVFLWRSSASGAGSGFDARRAARHSEMMSLLELARRSFALPPAEPSGDAILGDRFFVQGVPELDEDVETLPPQVRFVGSCVLPDGVRSGGEAEWAREQRRAGRRVLYVQLGRTFEYPAFWPRLARRLARCNEAAIVCVERFDKELGTIPAGVLVRERVAQDDVLPHCDAVVCSGHPTAVLGALAHGLPLLVVHSGSGTEETGVACRRAGAALAMSTSEADDASFDAALDAIAGDPAYRAGAEHLRDAFARYAGADAVCDELDAFAAAAAPAMSAV